MQNSLAQYTPRNPRLSDYYRCVEDYFEELERVHEDRYQSRFGYLRHEIRLTIFRYLDCGCTQIRCPRTGTTLPPQATENASGEGSHKPMAH